MTDLSAARRVELAAWADRHRDDDDPETRLIVSAIRDGWRAIELAKVGNDGKAFNDALLSRLQTAGMPGRKRLPFPADDLFRFVRQCGGLSGPPNALASILATELNINRTTAFRRVTEAMERYAAWRAGYEQHRDGPISEEGRAIFER